MRQYVALFLAFIVAACSGNGSSERQRALVLSATVGGERVPSSGIVRDVPVDKCEIVLEFSS